MALIYVAEDDSDLARLLCFHFEQNGHETLAFPSSEKLWAAVDARLPQLVILDVLLPDTSGLDLCRRLRASKPTSRILILMLSALGSQSDRIAGLEAGADDYLTKPFSLKELMLRVHALLSSSTMTGAVDSAKKLRCGPLLVEPAAFKCFVEGEEIALTSLEVKLLTYMMDRKDRVLSREQLLQDVWGMQGVFETRTIDTHVMRLREKLKSARDCVQTVRGVGYRFVEPSSE